MILIKLSAAVAVCTLPHIAVAAELPLEAIFSGELSVAPPAAFTALPRPAFEAVSRLPTTSLAAARPNQALAARPGCAAARQVKGASLIVGGKSRCQGGNLSSAEQAIILFDTTAHQRSAAASLALQDDPRGVSQPPLTGSAGLAMPLTSFAQIGVEYSYSQEGDLSPFHFSGARGAMDENAGHNATVRVDIRL